MTDKPQLLVVHDDPNSVRAVSRLLRSIDGEVIEATTGRDAWRLAREKKPDLILVGVALPDIAGLELCRQIKAEPALAESFIVLLSGINNEGDEQGSASELEVDDYIVGPLSDREFLARVKTLLRLQQVQAERDETLQALQAAHSKLEAEAAQRRQTAAALRLSQDQLNRVQEIAQMGHWEWHVDSGQVTGSDEFFRIFGLGTGPRSYQQTARQIYPDDKDFWENSVQAALSENQPLNIDCRVVGSDGSINWTRNVGEVARDETGRPTKMYWTTQDITAQKLVEEQLEESQRYLEHLADTVPGILYVFDLDEQRNVYSNQQIASTLGYTVEEIQAMGANFISTVMHPDDLPHMPDHLRLFETAGDKTILELEYRMKHANGEWRWLHGWETVFARREDGHPRQILGIAQDITEQKKVEEALGQSEKNLRALLDTSFDSALLIEPDGVIIDCNEMLANRFGANRADLVGTNVYDLVGGAFSEKRKRYIRQVMANGQPVRFVDDRHGLTIDNSVYPILDEAGRVVRLAIFGRDITAQIQSEEMLRQQHQLMDYIIRHDPNAIAVFDNDLRYIFASERYKQDYKIYNRNIIGQHHYEIFPEIPLRWREIHQRVLAGTIERAEEDQFVRPDGSIDYNRWECRPWHKTGGEIGGLIIYTEVITERKQAEEALRESEERYRTLVEAAPLSILAVQDGRYIFANPVGAEQLGYSDPDKIRGVDPLETIAPESRPLIRDRMQSAAAGQNNPPIEMDIVRPDGTRRTMESISVSIALNGHPAALVIGQDITERKQAEKALRHSEEKFRALVEQSLDGISLIDHDGIVQEWNPANEQITGLKQAEVLGRPLWEAIPRLIREESNSQSISPEIRRGILEFLRQEQEQPVREYVLPGSGGRPRIIQTAAFPIKTEAGPMAGAISRDVTEQKQAEEALRRYTERLELLFEIEQAILAAHSLEEICQTAVTMVRRAISCQRATVTLFDFDTNELVYIALDSDKETSIQIETRGDLEPYRYILQQIRQHGLVRIRLNEVTASIPEVLRAAGLSVAVCVPLMSQDQLLGSLNLGGDELILTVEQEELLRQVADELAIATQQTRLRQQVRRYTQQLEQRVEQRSRELSALYDVTALATIDMSLKTMLTYAMEQVLAAMGSQMGIIHLLDEDGETLRPVVHRDLNAETVAQLEFSVEEESLQGWVLKHGEPLIIPNLSEDNRAKQIERPDDFAYAGAPIQARDQRFGVLSVFRSSQQLLFSVEELTLLTAIADHIGVVVESARLRQKAERSAVLGERERLARELHDSVTQSLYSLTLFAEWTHRLCEAGEIEEAQKRLNRIGETAQQALKEMRLLLYELRPGLLEQDGLIEALERRLEAVEKRVGIKVRFKANQFERLPTTVEEGLYRIAQEALNNALKHAAANLVEVNLLNDDERITLTVTDNGIGFDPATGRGEGKMGLTNMQQRAKQIGGVLNLASHPKHGTSVTITVERSQ